MIMLDKVIANILENRRKEVFVYYENEKNKEPDMIKLTCDEKVELVNYINFIYLKFKNLFRLRYL